MMLAGEDFTSGLSSKSTLPDDASMRMAPMYGSFERADEPDFFDPPDASSAEAF